MAKHGSQHVLKYPDAKRILVMRYRFIGDTLLTIPFLQNLRQAYPEAVIDMLVAPNSGELLEGCPYIDNLIYFDTTRKHAYENTEDGTKPKRFWDYVGILKENQYDLSFVLKRSFSSALLAFLAGIPKRIGFNTEARGLLLTDRIAYDETIHEVDSFLQVLEHVGVSTDERVPTLWSGLEKTDMNLAPDRRHVMLHLTASNKGKEWPKDQYEPFVKTLLETYPDVILHAFGASMDREVYETLGTVLSAEHSARLMNHCGELSLTQSMRAMTEMTLCVGVDSGSLHMASIAGVPVVALFGPMDEKKWAPVGVHGKAHVLAMDLACRPCRLKTPCSVDFECIRTLSYQTVFDAVAKVLGSKVGAV